MIIDTKDQISTDDYNQDYNQIKSDDLLSVIDAKLEVVDDSSVRLNISSELKSQQSPQQLQQTAEWMTDPDYKKRFLAEYYQLRIRLAKLTAMLVQYKSRTLSFTPDCPYDILESQRQIMAQYLSILEQRASIEGIDLIN